MVTFEADLGDALVKTGLWATKKDPALAYIGSRFHFYAISGLHHHVLVGTITGIDLSNEWGLKLYSSVPEFGGKKLLYLSYDEDFERWYVRLAEDDSLTEDCVAGALKVQRAEDEIRK